MAFAPHLHRHPPHGVASHLPSAERDGLRPRNAIRKTEDRNGSLQTTVKVMVCVKEKVGRAGPLGTLTTAWTLKLSPTGIPTGNVMAIVSVPFGQDKMPLG